MKLRVVSRAGIDTLQRYRPRRRGVLVAEHIAQALAARLIPKLDRVPGARMHQSVPKSTSLWEIQQLPES